MSNSWIGSKSNLVWAALIVGLMFACSSEDEGVGLPDPSSRRANEPEKVATAEEVAEQKRGDVDCPADFDTPARADGTPVDDVVGVRPGLTYEEAAHIVLCSEDMLVLQEGGRQFNIQTFGQTLRQGFTAKFAEAEKTNDEIRKEMQEGFSARMGNAVTEDMRPGQSKWYVASMGMPGSERVIAVAREEWFDEGKNPTLDAVAQAIGTTTLLHVDLQHGAPTPFNSLQYFNMAFVADSPSTTLRFSGLTEGVCGVTIDVIAVRGAAVAARNEPANTSPRYGARAASLNGPPT